MRSFVNVHNIALQYIKPSVGRLSPFKPAWMLMILQFVTRYLWLFSQLSVYILKQVCCVLHQGSLVKVLLLHLVVSLSTLTTGMLVLHQLSQQLLAVMLETYIYISFQCLPCPFTTKLTTCCCDEFPSVSLLYTVLFVLSHLTVLNRSAFSTSWVFIFSSYNWYCQ